MRARRYVMCGLVALAVTAAAAPAVAQEASNPPATTTTTTQPPAASPPSTTTTTTAAPPSGSPPSSTSSTSTTAAPPQQQPAPAPVIDPKATPPDLPGEASSEPPPTDPVVVPPRDTPRPPTVEDAITNRNVSTQLTLANDALLRALEIQREASARAVGLDAEVAAMQLRLDELRRQQQLAVRTLGQKREALRRRVIGAYTASSANRLNVLLDVRDVNELSRRAALLQAITEQDRRAVAEYETTRDAANMDLTGEAEAVEAKGLLADEARRQAGDAVRLLTDQQTTVESLRQGGAIAANGFVFPVDEPYVFADTFGAPRMTGTSFEHKHQGTDIFAPTGTPLRAVERAVVVRVGTDTLGGIKLWLVGQTDTRYYYAHLSGYAPGMADGVVVEAGDVVGYVGNTGNARSTPPHLHFEIHPGGGAAINPYPLLKSASDAARAARALGATTPSS